MSWRRSSAKNPSIISIDRSLFIGLTGASPQIRDVADLERSDEARRMDATDHPRRLPHSGRPLARAGAVVEPDVERHPDEADVDSIGDLVAAGAHERGNVREARDDGGVDGLEVGMSWHGSAPGQKRAAFLAARGRDQPHSGGELATCPLGMARGFGSGCWLGRGPSACVLRSDRQEEPNHDQDRHRPRERQSGPEARSGSSLLGAGSIARGGKSGCSTGR